MQNIYKTSEIEEKSHYSSYKENAKKKKCNILQKHFKKKIKGSQKEQRAAQKDAK
jgi:hypothetical protein